MDVLGITGDPVGRVGARVATFYNVEGRFLVVRTKAVTELTSTLVFRPPTFFFSRRLKT